MINVEVYLEVGNVEVVQVEHWSTPGDRVGFYVFQADDVELTKEELIEFSNRLNQYVQSLS